MKLEIWMELNMMKASQLARLIKVSQTHIHKYLYEQTIPKAKIMKRIYAITFGSVTADDFYGLNAEIFKQELLKRQLANREKQQL